MELIFYKGRDNWEDRLVQWWTKGAHSHVEIRFSDGDCFSASWRENRVRFKRFPIDSKHWDRYQIADVSVGVEQDMRNCCLGQVGCKYDYLSVLGFISGWRGLGRRRWFCSEVCAAMLCRFDVLHVSTKVSPNFLFKHVMSNPRFKPISE